MAEQQPGPFLHVLTHKDLHLHPVKVLAQKNAMEGAPGQWCAPSQLAAVGLPAPVRSLLQNAD